MGFPPGDQILWREYHDASGKPLFAMTSPQARNCYYLYDISGKKPERLGQGKSPPELEKKYAKEMRRVR